MVDLFAKLAGCFGVHILSTKSSIRAAGFAFCPTCLNRFACAFTALLGGEFSGSGRTAYFSAFASESNGGRIFLFRICGHVYILRERSGISKVRERSRIMVLPARFVVDCPQTRRALAELPPSAAQEDAMSATLSP